MNSCPIFYAAVLASALATSPFSANPNAPFLKSPAEVLPDGNIRDPEPTAEDLEHFLLIVRKNMVFMPGGTFEMGDWGPEVNENGLPFDGTQDSKPLHKVTLSAFSIGKYPVTYAEFDTFTAARRLPRINQREVAKPHRKPSNPAGVTWQGAKDYCLWLAQVTGERFDLPTEAQWEYAARSGGKRHLYPTDNGKSEPGRNLPTYEQEEAAGGLMSVSSFPPNSAGIYFTSAGVHEFTNDWYDPAYYEKSPLLNPKGPSTGTVRVVRGHNGSSESAMTFKRWRAGVSTPKGTWTKYESNGKVRREIQHTQYSNFADNAFRCARN